MIYTPLCDVTYSRLFIGNMAGPIVGGVTVFIVAVAVVVILVLVLYLR